jgi:hypothetical protein
MHLMISRNNVTVSEKLVRYYLIEGYVDINTRSHIIIKILYFNHGLPVTEYFIPPEYIRKCK